MTGLAVENLSYAYGPRKVLKNISFTVEQGAFCALLGPNGAGKSTLYALLTRLFTAPKGRIELAGMDLRQSPLAALAQIGVVFQQPTLDMDLTVEQNLHYFASLQGLVGNSSRNAITGALDVMSIADRRRTRVRDLNGGHRRRTEIARALLHRPQLLLLDEPTVGLDAAARDSLTAHIHGLCHSQNLTVLWATHLVDEVRPEDRLLILHQGKLLRDGIAGDIGGADLAANFLDLTAAPA
ncbi:MAG: ATP-binding cassette domain-containing protein [Mangrovicoccus sp.]|nr:ATP-binding cassette domain-containing protein [Mangrovicoccus sp.]